VWHSIIATEIQSESRFGVIKITCLVVGLPRSCITVFSVGSARRHSTCKSEVRGGIKDRNPEEKLNMLNLAGFARCARIAITAMGLVAAGLTASCGAGVRVGYRAYDPYRSDYHVWDANEGTFYSQWTVETHRNPRDYRKLNRHDQQEYWRWRHDHDRR
jgi:hypothetical protein